MVIIVENGFFWLCLRKFALNSEILLQNPIMVYFISPYFPLFFSDSIGLSYIIAIGVLNSVTPLILELGSELTHPVSEDIIAGIINQANNFVGVLFYFLFSYLSPGDWLLYLLMVIPVTTLILFSMTKEYYNRRDNVEIAE